MSVADWITSAIGFLGVVSTGWLGVKGYRATTRADQDRAAQLLAQKIADARAEERARFDPLTRELERQRDEARSDRDYERTRADNLQTLINQWQIGRGD